MEAAEPRLLVHLRGTLGSGQTPLAVDGDQRREDRHQRHVGGVHMGGQALTPADPGGTDAGTDPVVSGAAPAAPGAGRQPTGAGPIRPHRRMGRPPPG